MLWVYFQIRPCIAKHLSFLNRVRLECYHSQNSVCWKLVTATLLFIKLGNWLPVSLKCQVQTGFQAYFYKKKWDLFSTKFQLSLLQLLLIGSVTPKWQTKGLRFCNQQIRSDQSLSRVRLFVTDPMNRSIPGLPVHHQLPEFTQTHVHRVSDAIQPSYPLSSPSPLAPNPSQHQSLFQWVNSSHEVAKLLEFQL